MFHVGRVEGLQLTEVLVDRVVIVNDEVVGRCQVCRWTRAAYNRWPAKFTEQPENSADAQRDRTGIRSAAHSLGLLYPYRS